LLAGYLPPKRGGAKPIFEGVHSSISNGQRADTGYKVTVFDKKEGRLALQAGTPFAAQDKTEAQPYSGSASRAGSKVTARQKTGTPIQHKVAEGAAALRPYGGQAAGFYEV
jgi:hypothetical protein